MDEIPENKGWTGEKIAQAYSSNPVSISHLAKRFVEERLESALSRREQKNRARKVDGEVEAKVIALACSDPPESRERWTVRLLRDEVVRLDIADIEHGSINNILKKMNSSRGV